MVNYQISVLFLRAIIARLINNQIFVLLLCEVIGRLITRYMCCYYVKSLHG